MRVWGAGELCEWMQSLADSDVAATANGEALNDAFASSSTDADSKLATSATAQRKRELLEGHELELGRIAG